MRRNRAPVAICVPARNEAAMLPALLHGLARQDGLAESAPLVCLYLDGCSDDSAALIARLAPLLPFALHVAESHGDHAANAGSARRAAMALGLEAAGLDAILLTTDADTVPQEDWLATSLAALDHADMAAGRIVRSGGVASPLQDRIEAYSDLLHGLRRSLDPVPWEARATHHYTGGASLAFGSGVYAALGGFAPIAAGEDARIADEAGRAGYTLRRDGQVVVRTSARRQGRAVGGLASALRLGDGEAALPLVAHPADEAWRFALQARARQLHGAMGEVARQAFAREVGLPLDEVAQVERETRNGEAFAMRIVGAPPGGMRQVRLDEAETELERQLLDQTLVAA